VSLVSGTLAFHMAGEKAWSAAGLNYPVASGASFSSAPNARAQIQLGPNTLALDSGSTLGITTLDAATTKLGLWSGRLELHIRTIDAGQSIAVDLPVGGLWLLAPGQHEIAGGGGARRRSRMGRETARPGPSRVSRERHFFSRPRAVRRSARRL
jgi:hypothetical protein